MRDADTIRRAWGCMLGQVAGDSLGSQVEFKDAEQIRELYPSGMENLEGSKLYRTLPGQPTDDSEMALALARVLAEQDEFRAEPVLEAYKRWQKSHPVDFAHAVFRAMHGKVDAKSEANCALMRVSPLGIFGARRVPASALSSDGSGLADVSLLCSDEAMKTLQLWAMEEAALTNPHPLCRVSSAAYVTALACGIRGCGRRGMYEAALKTVQSLAQDGELGEAALRVQAVLEQAEHGRPADYQETMSHVLTALHNGFWQLLHAEDGGAGVRDTVLQGGDTAANGAVAGALLGAALDIDTFPPQWVDSVLACLPAEGRCDIPRPKEYWPLDFMPLAEKLLG